MPASRVLVKTCVSLWDKLLASILPKMNPNHTFCLATSNMSNQAQRRTKESVIPGCGAIDVSINVCVASILGKTSIYTIVIDASDLATHFVLRKYLAKNSGERDHCKCAMVTSFLFDSSNQSGLYLSQIPACFKDHLPH